MAKPKKDGQFINCYLDRTQFNRLCFYADQKGQTRTRAIEMILKDYLDKEGVPPEIECVESCGGIKFDELIKK